MDLQNAIKKGYKMKFEPPQTLTYCIGELMVIDEMLDGPHERELSVKAVEGLSGLLSAIAEDLEKIARKVARQIDDAPEPETEIQDKENAPETETAKEPVQGQGE